MSIHSALVASIGGGLLGGIAMGVILHAGSNMMPLVGALYGWPTVLGGWIAHLVNSVVIGLGFGLLASRPLLREQTATLWGSASVGIVYGAGVGLVTGGIMLPATLNLIGAQSLPEPVLPLPGAIGSALVVVSVGVAHVVYGALLGATFGTLYRARERSSSQLDRETVREAR